jgi:RNA polymerase sigma-70 factor (sigma-E family)
VDATRAGPAGGPKPASAGTALAAVQVQPGWDEGAVAALYQMHYRPLVRLAALLVGDIALAEDVVQDCFVAMHGAWRRLEDADRAKHYLRRSVINRSRSVLRHRAVAGRYLSRTWMPDIPSAEDSALESWERSVVVSALATLPVRQREALVLRYYAGLPDPRVAAVMGISEGAVKRHIWRALTSLRAALETELAPRSGLRADYPAGSEAAQQPAPAMSLNLRAVRWQAGRLARPARPG